jgi:hypothetical protein
VLRPRTAALPRECPDALRTRTNANAVILLFLATFNLQLATPAPAATVVGDLKDISIQTLNTKIMFAPTNEVLVTPSGLSAGPPSVTESSGGHFSTVLEAGDYTVSLPLIPWRHSFGISVFDTNGTVNITNLLSSPHTYTYTNNLDYRLKSIAQDTTPDFLDAKLVVLGSLTKSLVTNSGAVTVVLSNSASGGGSALLHANISLVTAWSTNGEASLLDSSVSLSAGTLTAGKSLNIEAFGSFADPGGSIPHAAFKLKLGSTTIVTTAQDVTATGWHLSAALTVRTAGVSGSIIGSVAVIEDNIATTSFPIPSQAATVDTTGSLTLDLRGLITDGTGAENVTCEQLVISLN